MIIKANRTKPPRWRLFEQFCPPGSTKWSNVWRGNFGTDVVFVKRCINGSWKKR